MRIIITIVFLLLIMCQAKAQSGKKINRKTVEVQLYTKGFLTEAGDIYKETELFCEKQKAVMFLNKKIILLYTEKFNLDLKVIDRNLGKVGSWLALSNVDNDTYYYVTPFILPGEEFGLIFQPVEKNLKRRTDLPVYTISSANICEK